MSIDWSCWNMVCTYILQWFGKTNAKYMLVGNWSLLFVMQSEFFDHFTNASHHHYYFSILLSSLCVCTFSHFVYIMRASKCWWRLEFHENAPELSLLGLANMETNCEEEIGESRIHNRYIMFDVVVLISVSTGKIFNSRVEVTFS